MSAPRAIVEDQLNALIDDRLDPAERAAVLAVLARSPELTARVKALRRQHEALRGVGQEILHEPVPERLRSVLARTRSTARGGGSVGRLCDYGRGAAVLLLGCSTGGLG
jgi:anti-sigma factor RsiW